MVDVDELLVDLKAVREGQVPVRAHRRMDVSELEQLEDGETVEVPGEAMVEQMKTRYKTIILALGALSVVLILIIIMLLLQWRAA